MSALTQNGPASVDVVTLEFAGLQAGILARRQASDPYRLFAVRKALRPLEAQSFATVEEARLAVARQLERRSDAHAAIRWLAA